jgi:hypothetical protein
MNLIALQVTPDGAVRPDADSKRDQS